eukprot:1454159-Pleurochrysis_carterae.AAC.3
MVIHDIYLSQEIEVETVSDELGNSSYICVLLTKRLFRQWYANLTDSLPDGEDAGRLSYSTLGRGVRHLSWLARRPSLARLGWVPWPGGLWRPCPSVRHPGMRHLGVAETTRPPLPRGRS